MNIELVKSFSEAFGPSGFEEEVARLAAAYCQGYTVENDSLQNLYVWGQKSSQKKPLILLDAHMDECGFMVQSIYDNGTLGIVALGGIAANNLPSQTVRIRTRKGEYVRGIIAAKPVHFMSSSEKQNHSVSMESLFVDVGATNRQEVEEYMGISLGDPMVMDVQFSYDQKNGICLGKSFDNRIGCACLTAVLQGLVSMQDKLNVDLVGTYSVQEEVGLRGTTVASSVIQPDLAIVFEGAPADDFFVSTSQGQARMKYGAQLRLFDSGHIANPIFAEFARKVAQQEEILYQETVRRGGGTNGGKIHLTHKGVPTLVLSVPSRYIHSHHNYCALDDAQAVVDLALAIIKNLDNSAIDHIRRKDLLVAKR